MKNVSNKNPQKKVTGMKEGQNQGGESIRNINLPNKCNVDKKFFFYIH